MKGISFGKLIGLIKSTKPKNLAQGKTVTYTGFSDQAPTNLDKLTNGNLDDPAGVGIRANNATVGGFLIDMGADFKAPVRLGAKLGVKSSGNTTVNCYVQQSPDTTIGNYVGNVSAMAVLNPTTTEKQPPFSEVLITQRYVLLLIQSTSTTVTVEITPYEIWFNP